MRVKETKLVQHKLPEMEVEIINDHSDEMNMEADHTDPAEEPPSSTLSYMDID